MNTDSMALPEGEVPKIKPYEQMMKEMKNILKLASDVAKRQALKIILNIDTAKKLLQHINNPIVAQLVNVLTYQTFRKNGKITIKQYPDTLQAFSDFRSELWKEKKFQNAIRPPSARIAESIRHAIGFE